MRLEQIAPNDAIWLQDSAANLMVINAVIVTDRLDPHTLRTAFQRRILEAPEPGRFDHLRCRVCGNGRRRYWERDPDFKLTRHIVATRLKRPQDPDAVQAFVGQEAGKPLDWDHSPWKIHVIQGLEADATVLLVRIHHSIGDGEALLGLLLALVDQPPGRRDGAARRKVPAPARGRMLGRLLRKAAIPLFTPGILFRRLSWTPDRSPMHGPPLSGNKRVAWTRPLDLGVVKKAKHHLGATVNDVLMAAVSGAFCQYLADHGDAPPSRFLISMPMNIRGPSESSRCDNHFAPVPLELPAGPGSRAHRIQAVKARMDLVKCSVVPLVIYNVQRALMTFLPPSASRFIIDFLANKCTAVVSNIKGPAGQLTLEGRRVRSILFWVPQRARIGIGISILSFSGKVQVGVIADEALMPDPGALVEAFEAEFDALRGI